VCAYCAARLKPVRPPSMDQPGQPASGQPASGAPAGDEPDWLRGLRSDGPDELPTDQPEAGEKAVDADLPDWFSRIGDREGSNVENSPAIANQQSDDLPDWMSALSAASDSPAEETDLPAWGAGLSTPSSSSGDDIDWLSGLNFDADPAPQTPSTSEPQESLSQGFGLTDFLRQQGERAAQDPQDTPDFGGTTSDDLPDFGVFDQSSQSDTPGFDLPGWGDASHLTNDSGLPVWSSGSSADEPAAASSDGDEISDWLSSFQSPAEQQSTADRSGSGLPDWLGSSPAESEPTSSATSSGLPSWLDADAGSSDSVQSSASEPDSAVPSWLNSDFGASEPAGPSGSVPDAGLPSWLSGDLGAPETPAAEDAPEPGQDLPNWFTGGGDSAESADLSLAQKSDETTDTPDWLSGLGSLPAVEDTQAAAEISVDFSVSDAAQEQLPDWFSDLSAADKDLRSAAVPQAADSLPESTANDGSKDPFIDDETPDWLRDFNARSTADNETVAPLIGMDDALVPADETDELQPFAVDLPDWLSEESMPEQVDEIEPVAETPGEELAQAELPEWVRDMRPIEAAIVSDSLSSEVDERVEKAGPLAGLRGILPTEDMTPHYRKPPVYSVKLRVSEKQRGQATLLESIVNQEAQPLLIPPARSQSARIIPRILVAVLLIVALLVPRLLDMGPLGVPVLYPAEMLDMFQQIEQAQDQSSTVLLAVDFEPGRAGEMQLAASPVIEHLMARGVNLVVVSTVPNGPALAERLLDNSARSYQQRTQQSYDQAQVVNLGYLPGGAISLLEFAQLPRRSAPADIRGNAAVWSTTFLQNISGLGDFAQIIVLTDNAETGRAWVEQVQPIMGDIPLFMVTSAQASPLLIPYLESQQISGLVSGVLGGAMYSRLVTQGAGPTERYLATYQVGMLLAFGLVLVGGLFSGGMAIFKRNEKDEA
jgi:hypothetical protein